MGELTQRNKTHFVKLIVTQPVKKYFVLCGTRSVVGVYTMDVIQSPLNPVYSYLFFSKVYVTLNAEFLVQLIEHEGAFGVEA
jgi:hypothetical protein